MRINTSKRRRGPDGLPKSRIAELQREAEGAVAVTGTYEGQLLEWLGAAEVFIRVLPENNRLSAGSSRLLIEDWATRAGYALEMDERAGLLRVTGPVTVVAAKPQGPVAVQRGLFD